MLTLVVVDDFSARSSDELSLTKGDRVELIERDDDFGDGWYLGRHLVNGASGLFPEGNFHNEYSQCILADSRSLHKNRSSRSTLIPTFDDHSTIQPVARFPH